MGIRQISREAYKSLNTLGIIDTQEFRIFEYIKSLEFSVTRNEIAVSLSMPTATVSARVNSLLKKRVIFQDTKRKDKYTNITSYTLRARK